MAEVGRPSKYKSAYCNEVIAAGDEGLSLTAFAGIIGVCRATINNWMAEHPEFLEATKKHAAKRTLYLERGLLSSDVGPRVTARIFALKNAAPEEWADKQLFGSDPDNPLPAGFIIRDVAGGAE
jgi:transposase